MVSQLKVYKMDWEIFGCMLGKKKGIKLSNIGIQSAISHKGSQAHEKVEN